MKTASAISRPTRTRNRRRGAGAARRETVWQRRRRLTAENASIAPAKPRRRLREARRWLEELAVRSSNGRVCERRPGARYITFQEGAEIHRRGFEELKTSDPELYRAVRWISFQFFIEDLGISLDEWKQQAMRRMRRLSRIRAELQRDGSI